MVKVQGVVVLYQPAEAVTGNIKTYIKGLDKLYVIDNSNTPVNSVIDCLKQTENIIYISNNGNKGIAHALNVGAAKAIEAGAVWLLTMDQDSNFRDDDF